MYRPLAMSLATGMVACTPVLFAQTEGTERFTFTAVNAPASGFGGDRYQLTVDRWSTNTERDGLSAALAANDASTVTHTLRNAPAIGRVRWPGGIEYTLRYARRTTRPDGGSDLVLIADSRVWIWWDAKNDLPLDEPFTVFLVRLDKSGVGEGKVAPASKARSDKMVGVAVPDYDSRPVLLADFRSQRG